MTDTISAEDLNCPVCLQISVEAVESDCCGHAFCSACAMLVRNKQNECPFCKQTPFSYRQAKLIRRMISGIKVECSNPKCSEVVTRGDLPNHLRYCIFSLVKCTFCEDKLLKGELLKHTYLNHQAEARRSIVAFQNNNPSSKLSSASTIASKLSKKVSAQQYSTVIDPATEVKNSKGKITKLGETGKYYCTELLGTPCDCCDGHCGPTNGQNCAACMQLDLTMRSLPKGYLVNAAGYIAKVDYSNKTAHCGKLFYSKEKCRPERPCIYCQFLRKTLNRYEKLLK